MCELFQGLCMQMYSQPEVVFPCRNFCQMDFFFLWYFDMFDVFPVLFCIAI